MLGTLVSACAQSSNAPHSLVFDSESDKAIVLIGTSLDRNQIAPENDWNKRPHSLVTHWQQYDPHIMQLVPGGARVTSLRQNSIWAKAAHDPVVQVLEIEPGDYALIGVTIYKTTTTLLPLKNSNFRRYTTPGLPLDDEIEMQGEVTPKSNFLFSVRPGKVVYIGHFDFVHAGGRSHKIVDINYWQDEAAARAALKDFPGITDDMVTLNLTLPTEQAALP